MDAHVSPSGVRLFLDIVRRMPEAPFLITGLNTEYPGLEEMEEIPNLTITPSLPINRGPSLNHLSTARLYIAPSEWPDPDGYTALQAMACGIPAIVPSLGAYPEAVGEAGLIIRQPHDPIAWVEQIFTLLHSRSLYDHFMEQGQTRARKLSLESQAAKLRTVLEMVVARAEAENVMSNK
jgi:glycosyltransferase involved in cell wall biosynthesis